MNILVIINKDTNIKMQYYLFSCLYKKQFKNIQKTNNNK